MQGIPHHRFPCQALPGATLSRRSDGPAAGVSLRRGGDGALAPHPGVFPAVPSCGAHSRGWARSGGAPRPPTGQTAGPSDQSSPATLRAGGEGHLRRQPVHLAGRQP